MQTLINEKTDESRYIKILFPTLENIVDLKIQFKQNFDNLLLFDYQVGTIDINSYFSKIAFIKNDKLYVFIEYENAEYSSYETKTYHETNFMECKNKDIIDFFIESRHCYYNLKYPENFLHKRIKI